MKRILLITIGLALSLLASAQRESILLDDGWKFAFGNASSPEKDFGCGTEYFNYLTKAASIHNTGPYSPDFDDSAWKAVRLPHDWVVDLDFDPGASHSHGYKRVGFKYPETSVGWYRRDLQIPAGDKGRHIWLQFDGIFRDSRIWVNGFYLGGEPSGYATRTYDISEYLNYGGRNVVTVRADATLEEGWFYEGAGIYRHVRLGKSSLLHVVPFGTYVHSEISGGEARVTVETTVKNEDEASKDFSIRHILMDAGGREVASCTSEGGLLLPKAEGIFTAEMSVAGPHLWSLDDPYLYTVRTEVISGGVAADTYETRTGLRTITFDPDRGFFLNGERVELKGANMHQDHAGVGSGIPDALGVYRLKQLKKYGFNAYRSSHNPMSPATLDACDSLGILVLEENRLTGVNEEHIRLLDNMIRRDRNHPSIIAWSVGNEEWGIEWNEFGSRIVATMRDYCHLIDPYRPMCVASSGGPDVLLPADIAGYNYILQNPVDQHRANYPQRIALGSEETSGCGTRGVYDDSGRAEGRMQAINRTKSGSDSLYNAIERGWKFYAERPWLGGLFYWTGFDYRGEPNPLSYPATGSEFGILDYCGFPKDEAFYLQAQWTEDPVVHILPHWNLEDGQKVSVWVYSNCEEVVLTVNGKRLGRKKMPSGGHLEWETTYHPGYVSATGYRGGKKVMTETVRTAGDASVLEAVPDRDTIHSDGMDVAVVNVCVRDKNGVFVPTACIPLSLEITGPAEILGVGNGDPAFNAAERPSDPSDRKFSVSTFNGLAQVLVRSSGASGQAVLKISAPGGLYAETTITLK